MRVNRDERKKWLFVVSPKYLTSPLFYLSVYNINDFFFQEINLVETELMINHIVYILLKKNMVYNNKYRIFVMTLVYTIIITEVTGTFVRLRLFPYDLLCFLCFEEILSALCFVFALWIYDLHTAFQVPTRKLCFTEISSSGSGYECSIFFFN